MAHVIGGIDQFYDFLLAEDLRQLFLPRPGRDVELGLGAVEKPFVETMQAAEVHIARTPAQFAMPDQMDQILLNLLIAEVLRGLVVVLGQIGYRIEVGLLGLLGQAVQDQVIFKFSPQFACHTYLLWWG